MIIIYGGVISRQNGSSVTYQMKCNNCGIVATDCYTVTVTRGVTEIATHSCPNCRNTQMVKMRFVEMEKVITP